MKTIKRFLLTLPCLFPTFANATELPDAFLTRCLAPLIDAGPFVLEGLSGPTDLPDADISVEGATARRQSWQFPEKNWTLGTMIAGNAQFTVARACGITVHNAQGTDRSVVSEVMSAVGAAEDVCQYEGNTAGVFGFRSVVRNTKRGFPVLVSFSPVDDGDNLLMAWEVSPQIAESPCNR